jgi:hypothetical protein
MCSKLRIEFEELMRKHRTIENLLEQKKRDPSYPTAALEGMVWRSKCICEEMREKVRIAEATAENTVFKE